MANDPIRRGDEEWRGKLSPGQYAVCRCSATEPAFTGRRWNHEQAGRYRRARCESPLGHAFPDGARQAGLRDCIDSAAPEFEAGDAR